MKKLRINITSTPAIAIQAAKTAKIFCVPSPPLMTFNKLSEINGAFDFNNYLIGLA